MTGGDQLKDSSGSALQKSGPSGLVDINCDMGEGIGNEERIMPFISSANIACGYHAGDAITMQQTMELCVKYDIVAGAHPSFYDKKNFGRKEMNLPVDDIYELITQQLIILGEVADSFGRQLCHVKPHGALYNMSARDPLIAQVIAKAVRDFDSRLVIFGLSGSHSIQQARQLGLQTKNEVFADRTYQDDGTLTHRSQTNALIRETHKVVQQVQQMINEGTVTTLSGKAIPIVAETICIHGDGEHAVEFAKAIREAIKK